MSWSGQKSMVERPGSPSRQNLGNLGQPDPVRAKIHRKLQKLSGLVPRKIGILGSALYRDIQGSCINPQNLQGFNQYSPTSNWHCPSVQHDFGPQPLGAHWSWTLNDYMLTSAPAYSQTQLHWNICPQTPTPTG